MPWFPLCQALREWLDGWGSSQPLALLGRSRFFASGHNRTPKLGWSVMVVWLMQRWPCAGWMQDS